MYIGCPVEVSNDPSRSDRAFGQVVAVKARSVDVMIVGRGGLGLRENCWHADDPRCKEHPDAFTEGNRGVFVLTAGEWHRRSLGTRLDVLEVRVAEMGARLSLLENPDVTAAPKKPVPKSTSRRGRPPKKRTPEPAMV
jgi:hypothetical protein